MTTTSTAILQGLTANFIQVEVDSRVGCPQLIIVGLANTVVREAKERLLAALHSCGVRLKRKRTIVNLAPAGLKKTSASIELAIAAALLIHAGAIKNLKQKTLFLGEVSLDGSLKKIRGLLSLILAAKKYGFKQVIFPDLNKGELIKIDGIKLLPINNLGQLISCANNQQPWPKFQPSKIDIKPCFRKNLLDMASIKGQIQAKRILEIAAAGSHSVLLLGPPGVGKTSLAKALPSILPDLSKQEKLELIEINSLFNKKIDQSMLVRPFRTPHSNITQAGLIGSDQSRPGEITLAHRGVLFLDEFLQIPTSTIEALRQPLEDGYVSLAKASNKITYPSRFILLLASNACACGQAGSRSKVCSCSAYQLKKYQSKFSSPILDRIELAVFLRELEPQRHVGKNETSSIIRQRVNLAGKKQLARFKNTDYLNNGEVLFKDCKTFFSCTSKAKRVLKKAYYGFGLSVRAYLNILKVAQTIADLSDKDLIDEVCVLEAFIYRPQAVMNFRN